MMRSAISRSLTPIWLRKGASPLIWISFVLCRAVKRPVLRTSDGLTNLMQLTVDTSFWTRYRSDSLNPDFGDTLPQAIPTLAVGEHTAIPRTDADTTDPNFLQAIANTAGFHFAFIEQGGTKPLPLARAGGSPRTRRCESCSASVPPRRCTSRPGKTKRATRLP